MKKKKEINLVLNSDEFEVLSMFDHEDACSRYDWCGEYSDNCRKCPVTTMFRKIKEADK